VGSRYATLLNAETYPETTSEREREDRYKKMVQKEAKKLPALQHSIWDGQVHGSDHEMVHTRHMRPVCERFRSQTHYGSGSRCVPSPTAGQQTVPENIPTGNGVSNLVLFVRHVPNPPFIDHG
jgi:hypothetical protein